MLRELKYAATSTTYRVFKADEQPQSSAHWPRQLTRSCLKPMFVSLHFLFWCRADITEASTGVMISENPHNEQWQMAHNIPPVKGPSDTASPFCGIRLSQSKKTATRCWRMYLNGSFAFKKWRADLWLRNPHWAFGKSLTSPGSRQVYGLSFLPRPYKQS